MSSTRRGQTTRALRALSKLLERRAGSLATEVPPAGPVIAYRSARAATPAAGSRDALRRMDGRSFASSAEAVRGVIVLLERLLPDSTVLLGQLEPGEEAFRLVGAHGEASFRLRTGEAIPLDASFAVLVATEQRPILSDTPPQPVFGDLALEATVTNGSYVGVPLQLSDDTAIGSLCVIARPARRYGEQDLELLTVMARLLAHEIQGEREARRLRERAEEYREHATTDGLTGLLNRRGFMESLTREWQLSRRGTVASYLVVADVDGLKAANDHVGHALGDELLQDVARALTGAARVSDTVGRLGGDEFGVVLIGCDGDADADAFCERSRDRLASLVSDRPLPVTLSMGFHSLADARSPQRALALADGAMYEDKGRRGAPGGAS